MGTRAGTLEIFAPTYAEAAALESVYASGEVVYLRQPDYPGLDMYHTATRTSVTPQPEGTTIKRWLLSVDYVEVGAPTGPLLGAIGWTFDAATALISTFDVARATFTTFNAATVGPL